MNIKKILIFLFFINSCVLFSQETVYAYARKVVDTMASASMHGRGYVNEGDKIAANYIKNEFEKFGLKNFTENYYQHFNFNINTFPGKIEFKIENYVEHDKNSFTTNNLIFKGNLAKNYLINASSTLWQNVFKIEIFDSTYASKKGLKKFSKKQYLGLSYILIDDRNVKNKTQLEYFKLVKKNYFNSSGKIILVDKLTWSQSQTFQQPTIEILKDSFNIRETKLAGSLEGKNKFIPNYQSQNVIGYVEGSVYPDSFIVFSAHYDHLGQLGEEVYFPGANDNASGCAMLLNLAKHYSLPENKSKYSIAFIAFSAEEVGLLGSKHFTENPLFPLNKIKFVFNMDIMGTGEDGITVVNGTEYKKEFEKLKEINTTHNFIKDVKMRGKAANSDHYYFSEKGVKSFFIYTMGGIKAYHDIYDKAETLPLNEFENLFHLITAFATYLQE
ncbi:MAG: M20/M25/M40 family metallo-hydrolase [Bacteroidia bacterium]|nr:M20/M25/M40 family metallo-hydrolase [Bacteroidia bacterium]